MNKGTKLKITHGQLYKSALWAMIVVFSFAALVTVFAILFDGFTSFTFRMLFVMWQVFWFGAIAILFARFYEQNTFVVARYIAIAAVIGCALLLLIGMYQSVFPEWEQTHYTHGAYVRSDVNILVSKIQYIITTFVYGAVLIEWHLRVKSDVRAVILARDITSIIMGVAMIILDIIILMELDDTSRIISRFVVVMAILAITGVVVTRILASIYNRDSKSTESVQHREPPKKESARQELETSRGGKGNSMTPVDKSSLVGKIQEKTNKSPEECLAIVNVFENGFLLGKQSKEDLVNALATGLAMSNGEAEEIYDKCVNIIMSEFFTGLMR